MNSERIIQGRSFSADDLERIRRLLRDHPQWSRRRLSLQLCEDWNWRNPKGAFKDMACRSLLRKLEAEGLIRLPPSIHDGNNRKRLRRFEPVLHAQEPINTALSVLRPLDVQVVEDADELNLWKTLVRSYHYLSYSTYVGENMKYIVRDRKGRELSCLLFGSAAWKAAARDRFIGWSSDQRARGLQGMTNNMRFLILPWVQVPHLASHILGTVTRRIGADWKRKYGHRVYLLETFVERPRFTGTCYRAANWLHLGVTQGRSRNDRTHRIQVPAKDVYVYPLSRAFRRKLMASE